MDDNYRECMGVASGCGEQEMGVASGRGWNLWVWRYIDFLIPLSLLLLYLFFFAAASLLIFNPRRAGAARVTVLGSCVCVCVCPLHFGHYE